MRNQTNTYSPTKPKTKTVNNIILDICLKQTIGKCNTNRELWEEQIAYIPFLVMLIVSKSK
jgi:hypothetical protein